MKVVRLLVTTNEEANDLTEQELVYLATDIAFLQCEGLLGVDLCVKGDMKKGEGFLVHEQHGEKCRHGEAAPAKKEPAAEKGPVAEVPPRVAPNQKGQRNLPW